jgi:hypothetical protein
MSAKLLLIAGFPNSGTTITAMILGQHPQTFATGELTDFPEKRQFSDHNTCSCGKKVTACDFWLGVRDAYAQGPRGDAQLAELIAEHAGRDIIIDVAHKIERVRALVADQTVDLRVIHMVRKRQAVLNSRLRRLYGRGIISSFRPARVPKILKLGRRHQAFLMQMDEVMRALGERGLEVDYDQLCLDPHKWLGRIGGFLGLDFSATAARMVAGEALPRVPHLMRGNGKLRTADAIVVRRDAAFKTELSPLDRWLYEAGASMVRTGIAR